MEDSHEKSKNRRKFQKIKNIEENSKIEEKPKKSKIEEHSKTILKTIEEKLKIEENPKNPKIEGNSKKSKISKKIPTKPPKIEENQSKNRNGFQKSKKIKKNRRDSQGTFFLGILIFLRFFEFFLDF